MKKTFISFYLKGYQIHVFVTALKGIGSPRRICFMLSPDGKFLLLLPHEKRDLRSHNVPEKVYQGSGDYRISSYKLCHMLAEIHHWDLNSTYRVPGTIHPEKNLVLFDLAAAWVIGTSSWCRSSRRRG